MPDVWIHRPCSRPDDLPDRCFCCGAKTTYRLDRTFHWVPPSAAAWGGVIGIVLEAVLKKECRVSLPLCPQHQNHYFHRNLLTFGLLAAVVLGVGSVTTLLVLIGQPDAAIGSAIGLGGTGFLAWLVVTLVAHYTSVRTNEITDDGILLTGACPEFIRAYSGIQNDHRPVPRGAYDTWDEVRDRRADHEERRERQQREDARRRMEADLYGRDPREDRPRRRDRRDDY